MSEDSLQDRFAARMGELLGPEFPAEIGLAVSGGGDSMAMLALAHNWTREMGVGLRVVTVDHGLRPESATEAAMVAEECAALGWPHETLHWAGWSRVGNLQDAAREARLSLIDEWRGDLRDVLFAHTMDDQAETVLQRLKRGSGVEGLSAMAWARALPSGMRVLRPLLGERRDTLRHYLGAVRMNWVEDPSNDDRRFDRVQAREALAILDTYGLSVEALAATAARMGRARATLAAMAAVAAGRVAREGESNGVPTGELLIDCDGFAALDRETQMRVFSAALQWVANDPYRPRALALEGLIERALSGGGGTLHGCEVLVETDHLRVFREHAAITGATAASDGQMVWDGRWCLSAPGGSALKVQALGMLGWRQIETPPEDAPPARAAYSLPALFFGSRLVACPALGVGGAVSVEFRPRAATFVASLESH